MIRSLNTAERAMQMQQVRIDALANNLANANSTGFRQILTRVAEEGVGPATNTGEGVAPADDGQLLRDLPKDQNWAPAPVMEMEHAVDIRPGAIRPTGRETDLALMGRGFFAVETPGGERYTRAGSFLINAEKNLTTPSGELLIGTGGPIQINGEAFSVEPDGTVMVDGNLVGRVKVVDFEDATKLMHQGNNLLEAPVDMGPTEVPPAEVVLAQGHLESSNVNPIDTLVAMIAAQRAFEVQAKILTTEDEMLDKSVNTLSRVR
ncbi:MAG: flagellar hook basal-body protein [Gemmatimonadales bacterium]|nr:flagellar hook basal-body protein [Gemmatimonadales bacterium]